MELFGEKSVDGTTIREIAAAAGQNVASISYHFGSKEELYHAVIEGVAGEIRGRTGSVFDEVQAKRSSGGLAPADALELIKRLVRAVYLRAMSRDDSLAFGRLVVREQMKPTPAFDILYKNCLRQMHEGLCFLVGTVIGSDPQSPETIIRAHALLGQLFGFFMARETIRRRLGWTTLEGDNAETVAKILDEHVEILLRGLQRRRAAGATRKTGSRRRRPRGGKS
jgi:AcrR family transcriptional regulator